MLALKGFQLAPVAVLFLLQISSAISVISAKPWLDVTKSTEERLELLMLQWNRTQIYAMVQGDTVVSLETNRIDVYTNHISSKMKALESQRVSDISVATLPLEYLPSVWETVQQVSETL
jgi:hypothetical protein